MSVSGNAHQKLLCLIFCNLHLLVGNEHLIYGRVDREHKMVHTSSTIPVSHFGVPEDAEIPKYAIMI